MKPGRFSLAASLLVYMLYSPAGAGGFLEDVARVVTAPVTAPVDATIKIIEGDDPMKAVNGPIQTGGDLVSTASREFERAHSTFIEVNRDAIQSTLGPDWVQAYDILSASNRVQFELALTSGRYLGNCMSSGNCEVSQLVAGPVAAALRDAYKVYIGHSVPLDPMVSYYMSKVVPPHIVSQTRWTVGSVPNFTLPGFLNAGHQAFGNGHAVTIANLIIFSRPLDLSQSGDLNWLLHELRHVEQYLAYSGNYMEAIDGFSVNYMQHYASVESDAQTAADARHQQLWDMCQFGC